MTVEVKESSNKPPAFKTGPGAEIELSEGTVDYSNLIATYRANSQIPGDTLVYTKVCANKADLLNYSPFSFARESEY